MARNIYYQAVGNPLQTERLPNRRPDLQLPYRPYSPAQDGRFALRLFGVFGLVSGAAMFAQMMHLHLLGGPTLSSGAAVASLSLTKSNKPKNTGWSMY